VLLCFLAEIDGRRNGLGHHLWMMRLLWELGIAGTGCTVGLMRVVMLWVGTLGVVEVW